MVILSNLKIWDHQKRDFEIKDISVDYDPSFIKVEGEEIDCRDFFGIPPGIDLHVHFREPGFEHKEDMLSGAEAALFGGILTVLDMPNTNPITDSVEALKHKKELANKQALVDILLAASINNRNYGRITELNEFCDAYKIFMNNLDENLKIEENNIYTALNQLEDIESDKPIIFHAEDSTCLEEHKNETLYHKRRPPETEAIAVQKILQLAKDFSSLKFHITHLSSSLSLKFLKLGKIPNLTSDTSPRYIFFNHSTPMERNLKTVIPPLRNESDSSKLKEFLATGIIDMISSAHSPHTIEEKMQENLSGMPGVQELLPSILTLIQNGELEWERAIEAYHSFPSKLLNIRQESINENLVIVDLYTPFHVNSEWIKSKSKWSPFQNTMLNGSLQYVIKDSQIQMQSRP
ncbi:MAG: dihydroorotase [Candidatus Heimdallarchaeaceae archaeon]